MFPSLCDTFLFFQIHFSRVLSYNCIQNRSWSWTSCPDNSPDTHCTEMLLGRSSSGDRWIVFVHVRCSFCPRRAVHHLWADNAKNCNSKAAPGLQSDPAEHCQIQRKIIGQSKTSNNEMLFTYVLKSIYH